jgi:hypothetical protein
VSNHGRGTGLGPPRQSGGSHRTRRSERKDSRGRATALSAARSDVAERSPVDSERPMRDPEFTLAPGGAYPRVLTALSEPVTQYHESGARAPDRSRGPFGVLTVVDCVASLGGMPLEPRRLAARRVRRRAADMPGGGLAALGRSRADLGAEMRKGDGSDAALSVLAELRRTGS